MLQSALKQGKKRFREKPECCELRALLVEDDPAIQDLMVTRLRSLGCEVSFSDDEASAVRLAKERQFDFALIDLKLHGDYDAGARVIRALRELPTAVETAFFIHSIYVLRNADLPKDLPDDVGILPKPCKRDDLEKFVTSLRQGLERDGGRRGADR